MNNLNPRDSPIVINKSFPEGAKTAPDRFGSTTQASSEQQFRSWRLFVVLVAAVVTGGCFRAPSVSGAPTDAAPYLPPALDVAFDTLYEKANAPAVVAAVAINGEVVWERSAGYADLQARKTADHETKFRIGSVTKLFTAVVAAALVADGRAHPDSSIARYLPTSIKHEQITIRQLATHTAGFRHYRGGEYANAAEYGRVAESFPVFINDSLIAPPGTKYHYSSYGYNVLGAVLESIAKAEFRALVHRVVLQPFELLATDVDDSPLARVNGATPYVRDSTGAFVTAQKVSLSDRWPSGGYVSTAADLARFGSTVFKSTLLSDSAKRLLAAPATLPDGTPLQVAWGWRLRSTNTGLLLHHAGTAIGGRAVLVVDPKASAAIAVLANTSSARIDVDDAIRIAREYSEWTVKE
jgi:serine beta-lactamase-like protein LACTB, mitochondrial